MIILNQGDDIIGIFEWFWECVKDIPKSYVTGLLTAFLLMVLTTAYKKLINKTDKLREIVTVIRPFILLNNTINNKSNNKILSIERAPQIKKDYQKDSEIKVLNKKDDNDTLIILIVIGFIGTIYFGEQFKDNYLYIQRFLFIILDIIAILVFITILKIVVTRSLYKTTLNYLLVSIIYILYVNYINKLLPKIASQVPNKLNLHRIIDIGFIAYTLLGILILLLGLLYIFIFLFRILAIYIEKRTSNSISRFIIIKTQVCEKTFVCLFFIIFLTGFSYLLSTGTLYNWILLLQNN